MSGSTRTLLAIATALTAAACTDSINTSETSIALAPAFQTIPVGFSANSNSFDASGDLGSPFVPEDMQRVGFHGGEGENSGPGDGRRGGEDERHKDRHDGFGAGGIRGLLMGGGLGPDFIGAIAFGKGKGRGPFGVFQLPDGCTFNAESGRVTCPPKERHDLTVNVSFAFEDAAGNAQAKFDTLSTDLVNVQVDVSGTRTHHDGAVTSTVSHESDRTVSGLARGSTQRTINGTAEARENTTGTKHEVEFTAERVAYDTTSNLVIPIVEGRPTIPSGGSVVRRMRVSITRGGETNTRFRREKVTFDGTRVVKVEITQDDVTKNCTITLPEKKLACEE
jgi:hypothetical protein